MEHEGSAITGAGINTNSGAVSLTRSAIVNASGTGINSFSGAITLVDSRISGSASDGINTFSGPIALTRSLVNGSGDDGINGAGTISLVTARSAATRTRGSTAAAR